MFPGVRVSEALFTVHRVLYVDGASYKTLFARIDAMCVTVFYIVN